MIQNVDQIALGEIKAKLMEHLTHAYNIEDIIKMFSLDLDQVVYDEVNNLSVVLLLEKVLAD